MDDGARATVAMMRPGEEDDVSGCAGYESG